MRKKWGMTLWRLIIGSISAYLVYSMVFELQKVLKDYFPDWISGVLLYEMAVVFSCALIAFILGFIFAPLVRNLLLAGVYKIERRLQRIPTKVLAGGVFGLIVGIIIAYFLSQGLFKPDTPAGLVGTLLCYFVFGYLGLRMGVRRRDELPINQQFGQTFKFKESANQDKLLDTSAIIDGRILDVARTGFVEGKLVVPNFVLQELRHVADSASDVKRNRGRRGLDVLALMQKELGTGVVIDNHDFDDIAEVDEKLLKLSKLLNCAIVTNDYNLNKVAGVYGAKVLNINELANALKTTLLPGEEMTVQVIKEGKEFGQGLGYLDDGTMIVVEDGKAYMNQIIDVVVTSALQTNAGRMIFVKKKA